MQITANYSVVIGVHTPILQEMKNFKTHWKKMKTQYLSCAHWKVVLHMSDSQVSHAVLFKMKRFYRFTFVILLAISLKQSWKFDSVTSSVHSKKMLHYILHYWNQFTMCLLLKYYLKCYFKHAFQKTLFQSTDMN